MGLLTIYHGRFEQKQGLSIRIRKEMIFIHAQEKEYTFHPWEHDLEGVLMLCFSLYSSLSQFLSIYLCVPPFTLILPYICPTFFSGMCCPCTAGGLLVPSSSWFFFLLSWWMETFKATCTVQASHSLINATMPGRQVSLMRRWQLLYQEVLVSFLRQFCIS